MSICYNFNLLITNSISMTTYFISDLHLSEKYPDSEKLFTKFLNDIEDADALYILGDLWDAWIGDEYTTPFISRIKNTLLEFSNKVPLYVLRGNRDFLLGKKISARYKLSLS